VTGTTGNEDLNQPGSLLAGPLDEGPMVVVERSPDDFIPTPWIGAVPGAPTPAWWATETWAAGSWTRIDDPFAAIETEYPELGEDCCEPVDLDHDGVSELLSRVGRGGGIAWFGADSSATSWTRLLATTPWTPANPGDPSPIFGWAGPLAVVGDRIAWVTAAGEVVLTAVLLPGEHAQRDVALATFSGFPEVLYAWGGDWNGDGVPDLSVYSVDGERERWSLFLGPLDRDRTVGGADAWLDFDDRYCGAYPVKQPSRDALGIKCAERDSAAAVPASFELIAGEDLLGEVTRADARRSWVGSSGQVSAEHDLTGDGVVDLVVSGEGGLYLIPGPLL
jgi:hypothetical protein